MTELKPCQFYDEGNGNCTRWKSPPMKCRPSSLKWFEDSFHQCDMNQVCCYTSPYGSFFFSLTDEDLEALKNGKVLFAMGEYSIFIACKEESEQDD